VEPEKATGACLGENGEERAVLALVPDRRGTDPQVVVVDAGVAPTRRDERTRRDNGQSLRVSGRRAQWPTWVVLLPTLILAVWAASWVIHATRSFTPEIQGDGAVYLSTAEGLRGHGLPTVAFNLNWDGFTPKQAAAFHGRVPSTVFPPGYPAALALTSVVAGGVRSAARALDVILVVVNLLLVGWLTARMTANRSVIAATVPAVLLLFYTDTRRIFFIPLFGWLQLHRSVTSEPLFMTFSMVGLLALHGALTAGPARAKRAFVVAAGAASAALLVRYVEVAFVLAAVIALVALDRRRPLRSRLRRAAILTGVAAAPTALFVAWARLDGGQNPTSKIYRLSGDLGAPFARLADYVLPPGGPYALRLLAVVVLLGLSVVGAVWGPRLPGASPEEDDNARSLVQLGLLFICTYVVFVMATVTFFDLAVPIDARIFAPIRALWYAVLVAVAYRSLVRLVSRIGTVTIISALAALLIVANWSHTRPMLDEAPALPPARTSVADAIARIPDNALILSNAPEAIYDLAGRGSIALPFLYGKPTPEYEREMRQVVELLDTRGGYVALSWFRWNPYSVPPDLQRSVELHLIAQSPERRPTAQLYEIRPRQ
jgi:hypothetical protein